MSSETNKQMLSLLSDVLHNRNTEKISTENWSDIIKELYAQTVYALPGEYIHKLGLSADDELSYLKAIIKNDQSFHALMREQTRILALLEKANIPAVVLKGASAAVYYPHPENRCMGDIDILVPPEDFTKAYEVLVSSGCRAENSLEHFHRVICLFTENNIEIELHNFFSCNGNEKQDEALNKLLFRAIPSREKKELCGYSVDMLPALENGLVLLDHINRHLSDGGLGLRQIIDWMFYAEAVLDDDFWENVFAEKAEIIGKKRLAVIITAMCKKYLGLEKDIHWCPYEPVCDELMEYILAHGNFGRKIERSKAKTVSVLKIIRNPIRGLATAQRCGLLNWEAAQKHKILKPFAWSYQLCRWVKKGIKSGVTIDSISKASSIAKEETEFMKKLGLTRS